jgi:DNA mismatch repair protein MutL
MRAPETEDARKKDETDPSSPVQNTQRPQGFSMEELLDARIIGIAFSTYILLETDKYMILLDQHAAHEKILYEGLVKDFAKHSEKKVRTQPLLVPEFMTITPSDFLFLQDAAVSFEKAGFRFEPIGDHDIILREIPHISHPYQPAETFRTFLDSLKRDTPKTDESLLLHLATSACKAAVKGHDRLDELEVKSLLLDLSKLENPYHCPHGRPIMIRLSQKDLEKEFKRIV